MSDTVIVTDKGFGQNDFNGEWASPDTPGATALHLTSDTDPATLARALEGVTASRVDFPSFADGRGFTIARQLRLAGFTGRLRAHGHVISDQYAMARRSGFDEVEISTELATRQPEDEWLFRANWKSSDYQTRLRGTA